MLKSSIAHLRAVQHQTPNHATARIKELEDEVRRLTMENARITTDLEKAQKRWERLKEGARRRRKEGNTSHGVVNEQPTIPEAAEEKD
jgi:hypothetical protein